MERIVWTHEAQTWLQDIHDYIASDNPQAAQKVIAGIVQKVQRLSSYPESGSYYRTEAEGDIRILLYGHYRIAYLLTPAREIIVLGVFHGSLDINRYIQGLD